MRQVIHTGIGRAVRSGIKREARRSKGALNMGTRAEHHDGHIGLWVATDHDMSVCKGVAMEAGCVLWDHVHLAGRCVIERRKGRG